MLNKLKRFDLLKSLYYEDANLIHETEKMIKTMQENLEQMRDVQKRISNLLEIAIVEIQDTSSESENMMKLTPHELPDVLPGAGNINDFGGKAAKEIPIGEFECNGSTIKKHKPQVKGLAGFKLKPTTEG